MRLGTPSILSIGFICHGVCVFDDTKIILPIHIVNRIYMSYEGGVIDETHRDLLLGTLYRNCMKYGAEEWRNAQENDLPF